MSSRVNRDSRAIKRSRRRSCEDSRYFSIVFLLMQNDQRAVCRDVEGESPLLASQFVDWFANALLEVGSTSAGLVMKVEGHARVEQGVVPTEDVASVIRNVVKKSTSDIFLKGQKKTTRSFGECSIKVGFCQVEDFVDLWQAVISDPSSGEVWEDLFLHQPEEELPMGVSFTSVMRRIERLNVANDHAQKPVIEEAQRFLRTLEGTSFESLRENQEMANSIQELLNRLNQRIACPKSGCGKPAVLDCREAGRAKYGSFKVRHRVGKDHRNHVSSTKLPALEIVPAPAEVRRTTAKR